MEEEINRGNIFKEKGFTVLFSIFYIFSIVSVFYNKENLFIFLIFIILSCLVLFFNYGIKRVFVLFFVFISGILRANYAIKADNFLNDVYCKNAKIEGQIVSSKQITNSKIRFFLNVKNIKIYNKEYENINSKILVNIDYNENIIDKFSIGDYIYIEGVLNPPKNSTNPYQFDYKNYLLNKNCTNILYSKGKTLKVIKEAQFLSNYNDSFYFVLKKFENTRNEIIKKHSKNIKSPELEILSGLVFGSEAVSPDDKIKENFKNSGLLHLLAASGLNVALIYGIWWWLASLARLPYNLSIITGAVFVILYTFMTGFPPSILRASIMLLFVLFGKLIDRKTSTIALIFFVGFLILLFRPKMIFDIGFQLSFMVTLGLVVCCSVIIEKFKNIDEKYKEKFKNSSRFKKYVFFLFSPEKLVSIVCVPLIAQLWVIPLQLHYFNNIAPLSVFANIAVVPFIGILSFIGFIGSIFSLVPKISSFIVFVFDMIAKPFLTLLVKISEFFASFKYSLITTSGFNLFQIFSFWGLILILTFYIQKNFSKKYLIYFLSLLAIFLMSFIKIDNFKQNLEIMMFDVQNADCFLIKTPNKKYIMIDSAKSGFRGFDDAKNIINPYLRNERIRKIDYLIITHFDSDHSGGAISLLKNFRVNNIIIQNENKTTKTSKEILSYLKENKLNYKIINNNETILKEDNLEIKTFLPSLSNENNENSIITYLKYKNKNILFMADCGYKGFEKIKKFIPNNIDILKIGHHGAQNSINKQMINYLYPEYSLISSKENDYNHPHYSTVNLLNEINSKIIQTKNHGFVKLVINDDFKIYHFNSVNKKLEKITF